MTGDSYGSGGTQTNWWGTLGNFALTNPQVNHVPAYDSTDLVVGTRGNFLEQWGVHNKIEVKFGITNIFDNRGLTDIGGGTATGYLTPSISMTNGIAATSGAPFTYTSQAGRYTYGGLKIWF